MHDREDEVFAFIRAAAQQGPATVTDREVAEFIAERDNRTIEACLPAAREVLSHLHETRQVDLTLADDGSMSAGYPTTIHFRNQ